jgi:peroxiredoxin
VKLKALLDETGKQNVELIAVSVDSRELLQTMADKVARDGVKADFTFLSDPGHRVIDRYGLLNPDNPRAIPHPTTYVIDQQGVVQWKFTEINYKIRPTNEMILDALAKLDRK